jgi:hypothetical protein
MNTPFFNNDVHAFSARIKRRIKEDPDFLHGINQLAIKSRKNIEQLLLEANKLIEAYPELCKKYPGALNGLFHITARHQQMGMAYVDPDLENIPVMRLFCACMNVVLENREGMVELWFLVLQDINGHCIQGDSHRLLQFLVYDSDTDYKSNE